MFSLCHPWFTTTNLSYTFPILETSATASCGSTGIKYLYPWHPLTLPSEKEYVIQQHTELMMSLNLHLFTLPQTNIAPANRPFPKGDSYSNHPFLGSSCWFQGGYMYIYNSSQWFEDSPFSLPEFLDRMEVPRILAPSLHQTMLLTPKIQLGNSSRALDDTVSFGTFVEQMCVSILKLSRSYQTTSLSPKLESEQNGLKMVEMVNFTGKHMKLRAPLIELSPDKPKFPIATTVACKPMAIRWYVCFLETIKET